MTNDSEDGNGLQYGFLKKKMTGCHFFKVSSLARKLNFANMSLQYGISSRNCFFIIWLEFINPILPGLFFRS